MIHQRHNYNDSERTSFFSLPQLHQTHDSLPFLFIQGGCSDVNEGRGWKTEEDGTDQGRRKESAIADLGIARFSGISDSVGDRSNQSIGAGCPGRDVSVTNTRRGLKGKVTFSATIRNV